MAVDIQKLKGMSPPKGMDFHIGKVGHVVLQVSDLERSTAFYTQVLGFKVSDVYPEEMMPGGMVFLRCHTDHHCLALVGAGDGKNANREPLRASPPLAEPCGSFKFISGRGPLATTRQLITSRGTSGPLRP